MIRRTVAGLYIVTWTHDFTAWLQWRAWMHLSLRRRVDRPSLTVDFAAPPEGKEGIDIVVAAIKKTRDEIDKAPKSEGGRSSFGWPPLPDSIEPWKGWQRPICDRLTDLEMERRQIDGGGFYFAPRYGYNADAIERELRVRVSSELLRKSLKTPVKTAHFDPSAPPLAF